MTEESGLPREFENRIRELLPDEWEDFLKGYEDDNYHGLRVNALKQGRMSKETLYGISETDRIPWTEDGYYYDESVRPGAGILHEAGAFYIQEPSAMSVVSILDPKPGDRVLDLCAAPGGKSTGVLSKLMGQGLLVANEIVDSRARILSSNIERMGGSNCLVTNESPDALEDGFAGFFDRIIVDAPCSGEGMFRKNPEALKEWSPEQVLSCARRQALILESAHKMLRPGGRLVYSTCTFSREENEDTVETFLGKHPDYKVVRSDIGDRYFDWTGSGYRLWPHRIQGEGHFVCLMEKTGDESDRFGVENAIGMSAEDGTTGESFGRGKKSKKAKKQKPAADRTAIGKKEAECIKSSLKEILSASKAEELEGRKWIRFGDEIYALPAGAEEIELSGIRILRAGLHLGTLKLNRFEPDHALAMSLGVEDAGLYYAMTSDEASDYLAGESLRAEPNSSSPALKVGAKGGWCLMTYMGYSCGWSKYSSGQMKNHYPKGLRKRVSMI